MTKQHFGLTREQLQKLAAETVGAHARHLVAVLQDGDYDGMNLVALLEIFAGKLAEVSIPEPCANCARLTHDIEAGSAEIAKLHRLMCRVLEWEPALPAESGLLDELASAVKGRSVEPTPVLDHRHIPDRDDPGFCAKCGSTRASHSEPTESLIDQKERLRKTIDKVILTVDFDQACLCSRCTAMRELQQAALASVEPQFKPAMTTCGSCGQHYDLNQGHNCPDFYAK